MPSSTRAVPSWLMREQSAMSPAPAITGAPDEFCTVTTDMPTTPSLVAVTLAVPGWRPTTKPRAFTVATPGVLLAHDIARPPSSLPFASLGVAVSWTVPFAKIVADVGLMATEATGAGVTLTLAVPLLPSLVAVIVIGPPRAFPVTRPFPSTMAIVALLVCHVTTRPLSGLPVASLGVAVSWTVPFTWMLAVAGVTASDATGMGVTVTADVPLVPSLVAMIVIGPPAAFPVTRPFASTSAIVALPVRQMTTRPLSGLPFASLGVAVSCVLAPTCTLAVGGATSTVATGAEAETVTAAVPLFPSLVAVMVTGPPTAFPVTIPPAFTSATAASPVCHVTLRPVSGLPLASFSVAVSCTVPFTRMVAVAGVTTTDATGAGVTVTAAVPLFPSTVALVVSGPPAAFPGTAPGPPASFPVARAFGSTVATVASAVWQVTTRPASGLPFASCGVAVSCSVASTTILPVGGVTSTDATGMGVTVTADAPLFPSLVAVMVTGPPTVFPVTRPFASTVATVASAVCQVTTRPVSGLPFASFGAAVSCRVAPSWTLAGAGVTSTDATGTGVMVTEDVPLLPSLVAVMVMGPPTVFPVTRPVASTVAIARSVVCQVTTRPLNEFPFASLGVAVS